MGAGLVIAQRSWYICDMRAKSVELRDPRPLRLVTTRFRSEGFFRRDCAQRGFI
jgi:hypothetical protein